jgi:hypothetical protein
MSCEFWAGLLGATIGAVATIAAVYIHHRLTRGPQEKIDSDRKNLLLPMLQNTDGDGWRKIETLARVIGADHDTTKRLLIELGARGSEKSNDVWGLISKHPLPRGD